MSKWSSPTKRRKKARRDCSRKIPYSSEEDARRVMAELQRDGRTDGPCNVYHCAICGAWHWGHVPGINGGPGSGRSHVKA